MMPRLDELPFWLRTTLKVYPWRRIDPVPVARLGRPLAAARVALVTSAGIVAEGQPPFDAKVKGGDPSFRVIDGDVDVAQLGQFHRSRSFDCSYRFDRSVTRRSVWSRQSSSGAGS